FARQAEIAQVRDGNVCGREHVRHIHIAPRGEALLARRHTRFGRRHAIFSPRLFRRANGFEIAGTLPVRLKRRVRYLGFRERRDGHERNVAELSTMRTRSLTGETRRYQSASVAGALSAER